MSQIDHHDGGAVLSATLLVTDSSSEKYTRIWRRWRLVILISLNKTSPSHQLPRTSSRHVVDIQQSENELLVDPHHLIHNIVNQNDLAALTSFGGVQQVASVYGFNLETGIDGVPQPWILKGLVSNFLRACKNPTIFLLFILAGLSFSVEIMEQGPQYGWHDGVTILIAVFLLLTFQTIADFRMLKLSEMERLTA